MTEEKKTKEVAVKQDFSIEKLLSEAVKSGATIETMERLLAMRRELKAEKAQEEYNAAMSDFQKDCPIIKKDKQVLNKDKSSVRYKFAPIDSILRQTKEFIQKHGFSYTINTKVEGLTVKAICKVTHTFGHSEESEFQVPIDPDGYMNNQQRFASALTFAKRYAFCNAFGILTGDEDNDAKSNDKVEPGAYEKVLGYIKTGKTIGYLIKVEESLNADSALTKAQKEGLTKMLRDKVAILENGN